MKLLFVTSAFPLWKERRKLYGRENFINIEKNIQQRSPSCHTFHLRGCIHCCDEKNLATGWVEVVEYTRKENCYNKFPSSGEKKLNKSIVGNFLHPPSSNNITTMQSNETPFLLDSRSLSLELKIFCSFCALCLFSSHVPFSFVVTGKIVKGASSSTRSIRMFFNTKRVNVNQNKTSPHRQLSVGKYLYTDDKTMMF